MLDWTDFLRQQGARYEHGDLVGFGDRRVEYTAARESAILTDLSPFSVLRAAGADAESFLQGQLTNDVAALAPGGSQYAAYCSPKGRMLATLVVRRVDATVFELFLPGAVADDIRKRLSRFVLRAKVTIEDVSAESIRIGIGGPKAAAAIDLPPSVHRSTAITGGVVLALPGSRFVAFVAPAQAAAAWTALATRARPAGFPVWQWLTIRAGVPVITAATQDQFVPQMANLDAIGGINFQKGCYTGQEIVARMQYLGRLKERMVLAHVRATAVSPGAKLFGAAFETQACGMVVAAAAAPGGGTDLLAVVQIAAAESGELRLGARDGPLLQLQPLPYALPSIAPARVRLA